jgi:PKD repeat protein
MPAPAHQFTNDTPDPVTYNVTLIGVSPFGCTDTVSSPVTVEPSPLAQFLPDNLNGCSPLLVNLQNLSISADSFLWDYGDGTFGTTSDEFHTHQFVNLTPVPQVFTVELTALSDDGCSDIYTVDITVYPQIVPQITLPPSACTPAEISIVNNTLNGLYFDWDLGNGLQSQDVAPTTTYINSSDQPETFYIQLNILSAFGCVAYHTDSIVINPSPDAIFTSNQNSACEPAPLLLVNQSTGATSYEWNYGDGTMSDIADSTHIHIFQSPGDEQEGFIITLTAISEFGCTDIATTNFTLFPEVSADFTVNAAGCSPLNATFINQSIGASTYSWDFGNGQFSSVTNPTVTYVTGNTEDLIFTAQLISSNAYGCADTVLAPIQVFHSPLAVALFDEISGCYPVTAILENASIGADSFQWVYGTGQTSNTAETYHEFTYFNPGSDVVTYNITLNAYTMQGCTSSDNLSLDVSPVIEADFSSIQTGCTPLTVQFDNNSTTGVQSYLWDFGDGDISNQAEPAHTFYNPGTTDTTYTVTLTIQNSQGCTDTEDLLITVYAQPIASFTANPVSQYWPSASVTLDNTTTGGELSYTWDMDDGNELYVEEPGTYTYETWGNYTIQLIADNGYCSDTAYKTIEILPPPPVADFMGPAQGCAPLTVNFTNLSEYAISSFWQFGDGGEANATNPVYTYWQPGTYTVTLTVNGYDGSQDVLVQEFIIEVYPSAIAAFTVTPNEVNVPGQPVYCLNLSQNANEYEWIFNDGNTSEETHPIHYFQEPGVYSITLIANNEYNCPDTATYVNAVYATAVGMIEFPNAFTPNTSSAGNGTYDPNGYDNDVFFPLHKGVTEYKLQIFNKWGELLFESNDVNIGWNGYYRDQLCRQDVYAWKASARFVDGQEIVQSGDVTLLTR